MQFTDPLFLFYFLPLALLIFRVASLGNRFTMAARYSIIVATLAFYAYENWFWCFLFFIVIGGIYICTLPVWMSKNPVIRRVGVGVAILFALLSLSLFKYINWFVSFCPQFKPLQDILLPYFGKDGSIVLPPGISFYVFEAISFTIDAYRGQINRRVRWMDYLTFLAMFPRFIAGPIVRYGDMAAQFATWSGPHYSRGLSIFGLGFILKSLFADQFAVFVPYAFGTHSPDMLQAWVGALSYTFQLYFDFWGYSLMAIGLGLCLGFIFPDNFRSPYRAFSITDFWRRWHITLSNWLRDYLYISLGGNRQAPWRVAMNLLITMGIAGLWHGAGFTFVVWGFYHGGLLVVERMVGEHRLKIFPVRIRQVATFMLVLVGWVVFRSDSFDQAARVLGGMSGMNGFAQYFNPLLVQKHIPSLILLVAAGMFWLFIEPHVVGQGALATRVFPLRVQYLTFIIFVLALLFNLSSQEIPFLYFQF